MAVCPSADDYEVNHPLNQHGPVTPSSSGQRLPRAGPCHELRDTSKKLAHLSLSGTPRPIRRPGGPRRRSGAALQIRTSRASTGVHAASPPREAHPTPTTSPGAVGGPLAAASGALVVEHRPPTRPSSERVRKGSLMGPAAVPWTQKLAPAEHSRLDPRPWSPRRALGQP